MTKTKKARLRRQAQDRRNDWKREARNYWREREPNPSAYNDGRGGLRWL